MKLKDSLLSESDADLLDKLEKLAGDDGMPTPADKLPAGHYEQSSDENRDEDEENANEALTLSDMRIVESLNANSLNSLDDDANIMGVPLGLSNASCLSFDKHINAISKDDTDARKRRQGREELDASLEMKQKYDHRYKEMPRDTIKYKR